MMGDLMGFELLPPPAGGPPPSRREVFGEGKRKLAEYRRARDARPYNVAENCNCEMCLQRRVASLQPSVAPPSPVGARIARPFISDVITTFRDGARRVIGATAKPLYPIDGKAGGLDRRPPDLPPRGRGTTRRRWKEFVPLTRLRKTGESSSADDGTRSARPRGLGGDFDFSPLNPLGTP